MGFGDAFGAILGFAGDLIGQNKAANTQKDINNENAALSREYAQTGIQWRVQDAKSAGIHPLAAMGIPLQSAPTLSAGSHDYGSSFASMGQNLGRAANAVATRGEKQKADALSALALERAGLENELLRSQISSVNKANNPPLPSVSTKSSGGSVIPGQGNGNFRIVPNDITASEPGRLGKDAGIVNSYQFSNNNDGSVSVLPSADSKQLMEDMGPLPWAWYARTALKRPPAPSWSPGPGKKWVWNPADLTYYPRKKLPSFGRVLGKSLLHMQRKGGKIW